MAVGSQQYMLRIFSLHDGLEFYILDRENQPEYKDFCSTGPREYELLPQLDANN